jgi:hypothetical protein
MYSFVSTVVLFRTWERKTTYLVTISIANRVAVKNYRPTLPYSVCYGVHEIQMGQLKSDRVQLCQHCQCCQASSYDFWKQRYMILDSLGSINHRLMNTKYDHLLPWGYSFAQIELKRQTFNLMGDWISLQKKLIIDMRQASLVTRGGRQSKYYKLLAEHEAEFQKHKMLGKRRTKCTLQAVS